MPRGDQTGPMGMGPMTGRAAGFCAGYGMPGFANAAPAFGRGRGFGGGGGGFGGGGRGRRNRFYATGLTGWQRAAMGPAIYGGYGPGPAPQPYGPTMTKELELDVLKGQAEHLAETLEGIRKRIDELQAGDNQAE